MEMWAIMGNKLSERNSTMRMYKVKLKGMGMGEFGPNGVWLTKEQLDVVTKRQYNPKLCNSAVNFGGRWFPPSAFETVLEERELKEIVESSVSCNTALLESLAEEGYGDEVKHACAGTGYASFANGLPSGDNGQKKLQSENEPHLNLENLERLRQLKKQNGVG